MDRDYALVAIFKEAPPVEYTLTISAGAGGTTTPRPGSYRYAAGSTVTVWAEPSSGYIFDYWTLDGVRRTENPITVTMDRDHSLSASFRKEGAPPPPPPPSAPALILLSLAALAVLGILLLKRKG
jgi:hypothetical protein